MVVIKHVMVVAAIVLAKQIVPIHVLEDVIILVLVLATTLVTELVLVVAKKPVEEAIAGILNICK